MDIINASINILGNLGVIVLSLGLVGVKVAPYFIAFIILSAIPVQIHKKKSLAKRYGTINKQIYYNKNNKKNQEVR